MSEKLLTEDERKTIIKHLSKYNAGDTLSDIDTILQKALWDNHHMAAEVSAQDINNQIANFVTWNADWNWAKISKSLHKAFRSYRRLK